MASCTCTVSLQGALLPACACVCVCCVCVCVVLCMPGRNCPPLCVAPVVMCCGMHARMDMSSCAVCCCVCRCVLRPPLCCCCSCSPAVGLLHGRDVVNVRRKRGWRPVGGGGVWARVRLAECVQLAHREPRGSACVRGERARSESQGGSHYVCAHARTSPLPKYTPHAVWVRSRASAPSIHTHARARRSLARITSPISCPWARRRTRRRPGPGGWPT